MEGSLENGTKCADMEKQSMILRMSELPFVTGRSVIKPRVIWDQGWLGVGRGCKSLAGD